MTANANFAPREKVDSRKPRPINLERVTFMWDLWTGLYMLEPWEKLLFSALALAQRPCCLPESCPGHTKHCTPPSTF